MAAPAPPTDNRVVSALTPFQPYRGGPFSTTEPLPGATSLRYEALSCPTSGAARCATAFSVAHLSAQQATSSHFELTL